MSTSRRRLRTLCLATVLAGSTLAAAVADASEDDGPERDPGLEQPDTTDSGAPELIKLYESKTLGQLRLPGLWQVTDVPDGVRAVEPDQQRPAAIEIGTVRLPEPLPAEALADAIAAELGRALGQIDVVERAPVPALVGDDKDADAFYLEITAREHDADVRYAVLAVTGRKAAVIASLGAPAERFDALVPAQLLQDIVLSIE